MSTGKADPDATVQRLLEQFKKLDLYSRARLRDELLKDIRGLRKSQSTEKLEAIASDLNRYEHRELQTILNKRRFEYDIFAGVPIELALRIFESLDYACLYTLRTVSKSWNNYLRSSALTHPILRSQVLSSAEAKASNTPEVLLSRAKDFHAFRTGAPVQTAQFQLRGFKPANLWEHDSFEPGGTIERSYAYRKKVFAWIYRNADDIYACDYVDLDTPDSQKTFIPSGRHKLTAVALTDEYVGVFASSG